MAATDPITSISGLAGLSAAASSASSDTGASAGQNVISNDPIMDIRLLASLPANLGQNTDLSA